MESCSHSFNTGVATLVWSMILAVLAQFLPVVRIGTFFSPCHFAASLFCG